VVRVSWGCFCRGRKRGRTESFLGLNGHVPCDAGFAVRVGHEARVHAAFLLLAGLGEGRLRRRVVLLHEDEGDHVADLGGDGLGYVAQHGRHAGLNGLQSANDDLWGLLGDMRRLAEAAAYGMCHGA
jgi:hypothetical protein